MKSYAQIGYEAYCDKVGWKSFDGKSLPDWFNVRPSIAQAWEAMTDAVLAAYKGDAELARVDEDRRT